jgi:hypothetical protein
MPFKEMYAVAAALATWGPHWRGKKIRFHVDSETVVTVMNSRKAKTPGMAALLRLMYHLCAIHDCWVGAIHIPGVENEVADAISRAQFSRFHRLCPNANRLSTPIPDFSCDFFNDLPANCDASNGPNGKDSDNLCVLGVGQRTPGFLQTVGRSHPQHVQQLSVQYDMGGQILSSDCKDSVEKIPSRGESDLGGYRGGSLRVPPPGGADPTDSLGLGPKKTPNNGGKCLEFWKSSDTPTDCNQDRPSWETGNAGPPMHMQHGIRGVSGLRFAPTSLSPVIGRSSSTVGDEEWETPELRPRKHWRWDYTSNRWKVMNGQDGMERLGGMFSGRQ